MKICITSSGKTLQSPLNPRFGRCPYFLIVDTDKESVKAIENTGTGAARGAGTAAAQIASDAGCQVVITGNVGPNALSALNAGGIKALVGAFGKTCEQALKDYNKSKLKEASATSARGCGWAAPATPARQTGAGLRGGRAAPDMPDGSRGGRGQGRGFGRGRRSV